MRSLALASCLAIACASAVADDMVWRNATFTVRLTQAPCEVPALAQLLRSQVDAPVKATIVDEVGAVRARGCWLVDGDGDVWTVDENRRGGLMPMTGFKREPGV